MEALWGLDQSTGKLNLHALLRDTLAALEQLPADSSRLRKTFLPVLVLNSPDWNSPSARI